MNTRCKHKDGSIWVLKKIQRWLQVRGGIDYDGTLQRINNLGIAWYISQKHKILLYSKGKSTPIQISPRGSVQLTYRPNEINEYMQVLWGTLVPKKGDLFICEVKRTHYYDEIVDSDDKGLVPWVTVNGAFHRRSIQITYKRTKPLLRGSKIDVKTAHAVAKAFEKLIAAAEQIEKE